MGHMAEGKGKWRFAIDRGGTFTDVVGISPSGRYRSLKLLSTSPTYRDSSIEGIRRMLNLRQGEPLPCERIEGIRFGTTVATNSLLERKGGRVALLITKGFADLLEIGYQDRPDIFSLCIEKPLPLVSRVLEVDERIDARGRVVKGLDKESLRSALKKLRPQPHSVAVVLLHAWTNPQHEIRCREILREEGFGNVFLSHQASNLIKAVSRGQSTVVDAYLSLAVAQYLAGIERETEEIPLSFMQSDGTLSSAETFSGRKAILSGPAGGAIAVSGVAEETGCGKVIGFDMGGTSTDVCRFDGEFERVFEKRIGGIPLQSEMIDIITVAAGGGSILRFDGQRLTVGPDSAGAVPGPACYGFGGPLTVTDANLVTGRIVPEYFPKTFGPRGTAPLDVAAAKKGFSALAEEVDASLGTSFTIEGLAQGFLMVANEKMAQAIREISVSRGSDVRGYALLPFGGAGGQHACAIAGLLDMDTIVFHPLGPVMSALGIGLARPARKAVKTLLLPYDKDSHHKLSEVFGELAGRIQRECAGGVDMRKEIDLRPHGAETFLTVTYCSFSETIADFHGRHERLFGFSIGDAPLEVVNARVEIREREAFFPSCEGNTKPPEDALSPVFCREMSEDAGVVRAPVFLRSSIPAGSVIDGPAFIVDKDTSLVIDPGFRAEQKESGVIVIRRAAMGQRNQALQSRGPDPVLLEVFHRLFMGVATEMGHTLQNTAHSVNMKERLDFSCALFDGSGDLVANAPHIPVHLGAMAEAVKGIIRSHGMDMKPGDLYLTNNPYQGGSHLPDMTVVCPVFSGTEEIIFFTAARGHHADVGGTTPGSMPAEASHVNEEGVLVDGLPLVRGGRFREKELRNVLLDHPHPVRNIEERIADLKAQIAACQKGMQEIHEIIGRHGLHTVLSYMRYIQENAEEAVRAALFRFHAGRGFHSTFEDFLDDGTPIIASITIEAGDDPPRTVRARIDFSGTGAQHRSDNLNAPLSVTRSAVLYVLRCLIGCEIPLNSGCLRPVEIVVPEGTILNPRYPAPVASGNVETSQRVVDVLLGALGIAAASQGTMNNLLFQVDGEQPYYETIAGGSGGMEGCAGASGVQVHMTNTRMTDPEILEFRHPGVRIERFGLRRGSGGKGRFPGGRGVVREIRFLKPAAVSILSERRVHAPYGLLGGRPGKKGLNLLKNADGSIRSLGPRTVLRVKEDDSLVIKTPGGGGYGNPDQKGDQSSSFSPRSSRNSEEEA